MYVFDIFYKQIKDERQAFSIQVLDYFNMEIDMGEHFAFCFSFSLLCFAAELIYA